MKKSDIEHIQRSRFLESSRQDKSQVENIVNSINLKYPELADCIEIPLNMNNDIKDNNYNYIGSLIYYSRKVFNHNLLA